MTKDNYYIGIAEAVSKKSTCLEKHYGAVIVKNDRIASTGYNGAPTHEFHCIVCTKVCSAKDESAYTSCRSVHAEMNAIISASKEEMQNATLYLAGFDAKTEKEIIAEPCDICLRLIKNAGIAKVINKKGVLYSRDTLGILEKARQE